MKRSKGRRGKGSSRQPRKKAARHSRQGKSAGYTFLDHPADVGFVARGKDLPELFAVAARAMCAYGWELANVRLQKSINLRVRAAALDDLLFSWLSELLFLSDAEGWVFKNFKVARVQQLPAGERGKNKENLWELEGEARGEAFDRERHRSQTYIKAVTYHQLEVKQTRSGWQARVFLDV